MSANNSITPQSRWWRVSLISARLIATTSTFFGDSVRSRFWRETGSASKLFKYPPFRFLLSCDSPILWCFRSTQSRRSSPRALINYVVFVGFFPLRIEIINWTPYRRRLAIAWRTNLTVLLNRVYVIRFLFRADVSPVTIANFPYQICRKWEKQKLFRAGQISYSNCFRYRFIFSSRAWAFCSRFSVFLVHFIFQLRSHLRHVNRMLHLHKLLRVERKKKRKNPSRRRKIYKKQWSEDVRRKTREKRNRIRSFYTIRPGPITASSLLSLAWDSYQEIRNCGAEKASFVRDGSCRHAWHLISDCHLRRRVRNPFLGSVNRKASLHCWDRWKSTLHSSISQTLVAGVNLAESQKLSSLASARRLRNEKCFSSSVAGFHRYQHRKSFLIRRSQASSSTPQHHHHHQVTPHASSSRISQRCLRRTRERRRFTD